MAPSVVVRGGAEGAPASSYSLNSWSDGGEGGGEVFEGLGECGARVANGKGNELHPSPVFSESRYEGGVLLGLLVELSVGAEVSAKADLDDDEGALFFFKRGRFGRGSVRDPSRVNEV